jgi:hypothetical protein
VLEKEALKRKSDKKKIDKLSENSKERESKD